jgi:ubiquinone/menaquinone biosynthesis C-methylase UbiE
MDNPLEYYDEAYFERGWERGTAYVDYKENARASGIFKNVAEAIKTVFQPKRALEIGCATGPVVYHLNAMGCETYGIDVSSWAVENREHENVILTPAHELPFEDGYFDLVFSLHSLEHIPVDLKDASFREISRVSRGGLQFHMMPIVGDGPYAGDEDYVISELRKDPTHALLHNRKWWSEEWRRLGWNELPLNVVFSTDTDQYELSRCQIILSEKHDEKVLTQRASDWNRDVAMLLYARSKQPTAVALKNDLSLPPRRVDFPSTAKWRDIAFTPESADFRDGEINGVVTVYGDEPIYLRLALVHMVDNAIQGVAQSWMEFRPGANILRVPIDRLQGSLDFTKVNSVLFGGEGAVTGFDCQLSLRQGDQLVSLRPQGDPPLSRRVMSLKERLVRRLNRSFARVET